MIQLPQTVDQVTNVMMGSTRDILTNAFKAEIKTDDDMNVAIDILATIKEKRKAVEKQRVEMTGPINKSLKIINGKFKEVLEPLDKAEAALKPKILAHQHIAEQKKREEALIERAKVQKEIRDKAAEAQEMGDEETATELMTQASSVYIKPKEAARGGFTGAKTVINRRWVYEVTDINALCKAGYVLENTVEINKQIKSGERKIPGLRIYQKETLSCRS